MNEASIHKLVFHLTHADMASTASAQVVGDLLSFPGEARAALYPTAELASIVVEAAGVYITGGFWLLGTMLLILAIVLTRPRSTRSPS